MRTSVILAFGLAVAALAAAPIDAQIFQTPIVAETAINSANADFSPSLTGDLLTIYWTSDRAGGAGSRDIWSATRSGLTGAWTSIVNVASASTTDGEHYACVRADDRELIISVGNGSTNKLVSYTRTAPNLPWGNLTTLTALNSTTFEDDPTLTADGLEIFFTSGRLTGANIFRATRAGVTSPWGTPTTVSVNSSSFDHSPAISGDGLTLIFSSTRAGGGGGSSDHWIATRPDRTSDFGTPAPLTEINTANWDHNGQQTVDGYSFYFAYSNNIYRADRILPVVYAASPPETGTPFTIYVRGSAASPVGVVAGSLGSIVPTPLGGINGALELNLALGFWFAVGSTGGVGRYATTIPVPDSKAVIGVKVYFQGLTQGTTLDLSNMRSFTIRAAE